MVTTSWCLTEILKSWKSFSSNSPASQVADSTSASGVAFPYFLSRRLSREPALTPMRRETPASEAALQMSATWSSNLRMLPGLTRTAPQPASMAAKTYLGLKWMSAMTGMRDCLAMIGSASASLSVGQATRTMSQPAAVSSAICCRVAPMSWVFVVVIDCTVMGASPPTLRLPTWILRVGRRATRTGAWARIVGMPRAIASVTRPVCHPPRPALRLRCVASLPPVPICSRPPRPGGPHSGAAMSTHTRTRAMAMSRPKTT